jgi:phosphoglycerate dehydrogenase-like enzyme
MTVLLVCLPEERLPEAQLAHIHAATPGMRVVRTTDRAEIEGLLDDVEIAVGSFPHDLLPRAKRLRWLQEWGAGVDWLLRHPVLAELDFTLTNASGVHAIPISEQILAYLLAFARGLPAAVRAQGRRAWQPAKRDRLFELAGKTMLLVGVGAIGARTAEIAAALGVRVLGIRRSPGGDDPPGIEAIYGPDKLHELLPEADFVVLTVPLSRATQGMIGERELRAMKPTSYLINIGRGGTIQQPALIQALREGWIAGAGLDVFDPEPPHPDNPLLRMTNVVVTPHLASNTVQGSWRSSQSVVDQILQLIAGERPTFLIDPSVWPGRTRVT